MPPCLIVLFIIQPQKRFVILIVIIIKIIYYKSIHHEKSNFHFDNRFAFNKFQYPGRGSFAIHFD